jgi:hypothetical protein
VYRRSANGWESPSGLVLEGQVQSPDRKEVSLHGRFSEIGSLYSKGYTGVTAVEAGS